MADTGKVSRIFARGLKVAPTGNGWKCSAPFGAVEDLRGKTILVTAEQGHGDMLMMARYLPLLKRQGARVLFQTHPALVRSFTGWFGADEIIPLGVDTGQGFDYHAPVFDLPYRFGTDVGNNTGANSLSAIAGTG